MNFVPLTSGEIATLRNYGAERARGLLHSESWHRLMAALQTRHDRTQPQHRRQGDQERGAPRLL